MNRTQRKDPGEEGQAVKEVSRKEGGKGKGTSGRRGGGYRGGPSQIMNNWSL
jgi:hypothetical protein